MKQNKVKKAFWIVDYLGSSYHLNDFAIVASDSVAGTYLLRE